MPATTKLGAPVTPASVAYTASNSEVTLTPRAKLTASKPEELVVNGALVTDTLGREIDGADDGKAGSDYIATVTGTRVAAGGIPLVRRQRQPASVADVVDHLLARDELTGLTRSGRTEEERGNPLAERPDREPSPAESTRHSSRNKRRARA